MPQRGGQPPGSKPLNPNPKWPFWVHPIPEAIPAATFTTYTDSQSGTITLTGSDTDQKLYPDSQSGTITLSGSATDNNFILYTDSASGTITLSAGPSTEASSNSASRSGTITLSGIKTEAAIYTDARSGTITLSGSAVDNWGVIYSDSRSGTITLSGSSTLSQVFADSPSGTISLTGSSSLTSKFVDSGTGGVTLTGFDIEHIFNVLLPSFLFHWHTGLPRLNNIEQWLHDNTSFLWADHQTEYTELNRIVNIEQYLLAHPVSGAFVPGDGSGTTRLWAIENYLLNATQSSG
jgi:hypothetical protein